MRTIRRLLLTTLALHWIYISKFSGNAELYPIQTADLPTTADNRIIGGNVTTIQQYPFVVQIFLTAIFHCGGSLLTTRHVLSAAHCFIDVKGYVINPRRFTVRAGATVLNSGGTRHLVVAIKVHESFDVPPRDNDVAVLMITPVDLTTSVARVAQIPRQDAVVPDNASVTAVGWGLTDLPNRIKPTVLNEVTVRKVNRAICRERFLMLQVATGKPHGITDNMICAGILDVGGKDACQGDSGGPLIYNGIVVGIISWGVSCAEPEYPGVSARVASYSNWVNYTINDYLLHVQAKNGTGNSTNPGNGTNPGSTGSLSSNGAIMLLTPLLYLILSV